MRRLNRDDDAPASAGTQSVGGDGPAKKVTLGAGYSQMDWMRLTKRDPDLAGLKGASRKRKITMEEVATHRTPEDGWTAFRGKVYNLTPYLNFHPGGDKILKSVLGKDCTAQFDKYHRWVNGEYMLEKCKVGVLTRTCREATRRTPRRRRRRRTTSPSVRDEPAEGRRSAPRAETRERLKHRFVF